MRPRTIAAACLLMASLALAPSNADAQATDRARIVGTVTDSTGGVLPGARVTLTTDGASQEKVSDSDGSFAFENLASGVAYRVEATLPGFDLIHSDFPALAPGETARAMLTMRIGSMCGALINVPEPSMEDRLLMADAVVHVRTREVVTRTLNDEYCQTVSETPAEILAVAYVSHAEWRVGTNVAIVAGYRGLEANTEYLALLKYNANTQLVYVGAAFEVIDGRTDDVPFFESTEKRPIGELLRALRLSYERNTRYRRYNDLRETPFETLRYKTGWVWLGSLAVVPGTYVEQPLEWPEGQAFEFADGRDPLHAMPKRNDRIRLKEDTSVIILDYGATGEARRNQLPPTQNEYLGLKDSTGRFAKAGRPYRVADVRVVEGHGAPQVWVRLVAGR